MKFKIKTQTHEVIVQKSILRVGVEETIKWIEKYLTVSQEIANNILNVNGMEASSISLPFQSYNFQENIAISLIDKYRSIQRKLT